MISCPRCSKENQDHYKFCLGCGEKLPREAAAPKPAAGTPPHGTPAVARPAPIDEPTQEGHGPSAPVATFAGAAQAAPTAVTVAIPAPPPAPAFPTNPAPAFAVNPAPAPAATRPDEPPAPSEPSLVKCPECQHTNPPTNRFCASCGFKISKITAGARPRVVPPEPAPAPVVVPPIVLTVLRPDGSEAGTFNVARGSTTIGRSTGDVFGSDSYMSPRHATFTARDGKIFLRDEGSANGIYRKLQREVATPIRFGDVFRVGQELLRIEPIERPTPSPDGIERLGSPAKGVVARLTLIIGRDATGSAYVVGEEGVTIGRERGHVLFPEDGYVSGLHCRVTAEGGQLVLTDLGSSNGTFLRLSAETEVQSGEVVLMGQQLFRITF